MVSQKYSYSLLCFGLIFLTKEPHLHERHSYKKSYFYHYTYNTKFQL